jgi:DNA-binding CsgD family transcriptional regulator
VTVATDRRRVDDLARRCRAGLDAASLRDQVLRGLRAIVPVDAAFFATVDPATILFTSVLAEEPLIEAQALFLDNEFGRDDVNKFTALAAAPDHVSSLDRATAGDRASSARYAEVMAPLDLGDELRAALVAGGRCWGVLCLHRADSPTGFSAHELALVRRLVPHVAEGLRRAVVAAALTVPGAPVRGPGVIVLDEALAITSTNHEAEQWLAELHDPRWTDPGGGPLPVAILAAAARVAHVAGVGGVAGGGARSEPGAEVLSSGPAAGSAVPVTRVRTSSGAWLSVHASRLGGERGGQTAVVLEPARPMEMASLHLDAHGLTPAQCRVASLVLQGRSTQQIVNQLAISSYTVQEHLRAVFDKFGVGSRRELVGVLLGSTR